MSTSAPSIAKVKKISLDRFDLISCVILLLCYGIGSKLPFAPAKLGDGIFHAEAKTLALAIRGVVPWQQFGVSRAPGPVLFYAIPYLVVPPGSDNNRYWQAAFTWTIGWMLLSLLLMRRVGALLVSALTGKLTVALMLLTPFWVYYSYGILAEPPAFLGSVLFVYGWLRWRHSGEGPSLCAEGAWLACVGLSLLVLSRPNALILLGLALLAAASLYHTKRPQEISTAKATIVTAVCVSLVVGAAAGIVRALPKHQQGEYFVYTLFMGAFEYRTEPWDWRFWDKVRRRGSADYEAWDHVSKEIERQSRATRSPASGLMMNWLVKDVAEHPFLWNRMAAVRTLALHTSFVNSARPAAFRVGPVSGRVVYTIFHVLVNALNIILIGGAAWFLFENRGRLASYWPLWGPWLSIAVFYAVAYAEPRYLFPARPLITVMAAAALTPAATRVLTQLRKGRTVSL